MITEKQTLTTGSPDIAYIKLFKSELARTGRIKYNWEIKQLSLDIAELEKLNNELLNKFGSPDDTD